MDCEQVKRGDLAEKYLLGHLGEAEQDAFEQHYFECTRCFEEVRCLRSIQAGLEGASITPQAAPVRMGLRRRWDWALGMACVLILALLSYRLWRPSAGGQPPVNPPVATSPHVPAQPMPSPLPQPTLAELAQVEPPAYTATVLRGASDEATLRFRRAMERYQKKEYREAIPGLREAARLNPRAADAQFFLGACVLLIGQTKAAVEELQKTIALGESPYLEDAHFYLAKAYLRQRNVFAAQRELQRTMQLKGEREKEARDLLHQLEAISPKQP